jgi:2-polyprenyl-3-methyl-5-hydroxy-6-metoxy-1,4-benzoquinol methylase/Flp pilus assembly protein TadD
MSAPDPFQPQLARASAELQARRPAAAEGIYREILAAAPDHGIALHFLGMCLVQTARAAEGLELMARSIDRLAGGARWRHNYALMLAQSGNLAAAENELTAAASLEPQNAAIFQYLGMVRQQLGRARAAADAYRAACALAPDNAQLANNLGAARNEAGDTPAAASYARAVALQPGYAIAWVNLAIVRAELGDEAGAFDALRSAVRANPQLPQAWQQYAQMFEGTRFTAWDADAANDLALALGQPAVDAQPMAEAAASLLLLDPDLAPAIAAFSRGEAAAWLAREGTDSLARPLLLALLDSALVTNATLEALLARLRAELLFAWRDNRLPASVSTAALLIVIARQCFRNEYVWPETPPESAALSALEAHVVRTSEPHAIALLACYRGLADVAGLRRPSVDAGEAFALLWRTQVEEPAEDRRLRDAMPVLTPIDDATSRAVRAQYERNPYPRWRQLPANLATAYPVRQALRALFPHAELTRLALPDAPDILVAGCGTGLQVAMTASRNPLARILAIDLSRASLGYAQRRARELGLANIEFAQADLLGLGALGRRFHVVECTGVLHHLADPLAGWRVLRDLLQPGGVMKIALYSELARRGVAEARAIAAARGLGGNLAGAREMRRLVHLLPEDSPARVLAYSADFASTSGAIDLMLHVQEHRFTTADIADAIRELDLEFLGFEITAPGIQAAFRARHPDPADARSLEAWGRFEAAHPDAFDAMYQFWVAAPA